MVCQHPFQPNQGANLRFVLRLVTCFIIGNLCFLSAKAQPCQAPLQNNNFFIKPAVCNGTAALLQGSVPTGGNGTYSYQWQMSNDGSCSDNSFVAIPGATSKDYNVPSSTDQQTCFRRVVISGNCTSYSNKTKVQGQDRTTPQPPTLTVVQPTCSSGGTITITSPASSAGFSFSVDGTNYANTSGTFTNLAPGTYSVSAKHSAGCISPSVSVTLNPSSSTPTGTLSPASATICNGQSQVITATGGTSYKWYRNGTLINGVTAGTFTATQAGTYQVDIVQGTCVGTSSNSSVINLAPSPSGTISPAGSTLCTGDSLLLTVSGGVSYQWYRNGSQVNGAVLSTYWAKQSGTYTVDIINANGCKAQASNNAVVTVSNPPSGSIAPATVTICASGTATLTANGGTAYQWYRNGMMIGGATAAIYTVTQAGTYSADIINSNGCKAVASNTSVVSIGASPSALITPSSGQLCGTNASIGLSISGGSAYQWYKNGIAINGATSATYAATAPGTYTAQIFSGTCSGNASNQVVITQGTTPTGTISPASATICSGSSQVLTATGGTTYQWFMNNTMINGATSATYTATQGGTYSVVISNGSCSASSSNVAIINEIGNAPVGSITPASAVICSGASQTLTATGGATYQWYRNGVAVVGATTATYTTSADGIYSVDLVNSNGCKAKASNDASVTLSPTPSGSISPTSGTLCNNGTLTLATSGGATYQWYRNNTAIVGATSSTLTVTSVGNYEADVINANGCKARASNTVAITAGTAPTGNISPATVTICGSQGATLTVTGGANYQWFRNGVLISGATSSTYQVTLPGIYSALIFSGTCNGLASNTATVSEGTPLSFSLNVTQPTCTKPTGTIVVINPLGGNGSGYMYSIDGGANFQVSNSFNNVPTGSYQVVVKDAAGCRSNPAPATVNPSVTTLQGTVTSTAITCGQTSASATITASGGSSPYQYSLNNGPFQAGNIFMNLAVGTYKVVVKDALGCTKELSFTIQAVNSTLSATATTTNATCQQMSGAVVITASNGANGYSYRLDNGPYQTNNSFTNVAVGLHKATVKDQAGCLFEISFEIKQTSLNPKLLIVNPSSICPNETADLQLPAITQGSDTALQLSYWKDSNATIQLPNPGAVAAGTYYIKATNSAGCHAVKPVVVRANTVTAGSITRSGTSAPCFGQTVVLTASNGQTFQWYRNGVIMNGATNKSLVVTSDGVYSVAIKDGRCAIAVSDTIRIRFTNCPARRDPKVFVPAAFTPNNNRANDVLRPIMYHIQELRYFKVYNRWGQQVFQTSVIGKGWDGMINGLPQPAETYSWILECKDVNGNTIKQSGRSLLIR